MRPVLFVVAVAAGLLAVAAAGAAIAGAWAVAVAAIAGLLVAVLVVLLDLRRAMSHATSVERELHAMTRERLRPELDLAVERVIRSVSGGSIVAPPDAGVFDASARLHEGHQAIQEGLVGLGRELADVAESLGWLAGSVEGVEDRLTSQLKTRLDDVLARGRRTRNEDLRVLRHQLLSEIDALAQLQERFGIEGQRPHVAGWALSPIGLLQVLDLVDGSGAVRIVECGSGLSSLHLGALVREREGGQVVSLEQDAEYASWMRGLVAAHGLEQVVDVRDAPIGEVVAGGESQPWYDATRVEDLHEIDVVLVDGPPKATGPTARYPVLPLLAERLADGAVLVVDDFNRQSERSMVERWMAEYPDRLTRLHSRDPEQCVLRWKRDG